MNWKIFISAALAGATLLAASTAMAETERSGIQTRDEGEIYGGEEALADEFRFIPVRGRGARADRRYELNPLADRTIGWSSGYIAPEGTLRYTNTLVLGQRVGYSLSDDLQLFGHAFLPLGRHTYGGLGGDFKAIRGEEWNFVVGGQLRHRRTNFQPGTTDTSLGLQAVFDVIGGDNLTWSAGMALNVPIRQSVEQVDFASCGNRREFAEGECYQTEAEVRWMPPSGYWFSAFAGMNYFITDRVLFNAELFTGVSQGNFWGLEQRLGAGLNYEAEIEMVEERSFSAGLGPLGPVTMGLGTTWMLGRVGLQLAMYVTTFGGEFPDFDGLFMFTPYFSLGTTFGGPS